MIHESVLRDECIKSLAIKADGIYVDGTLGRGGHSIEILKRIPNGHLYAIDCDQEAIQESKARIDSIAKNYTLLHSKFSQIKTLLASQGIQKIDGFLLDLGVSSPQFDDPKRGFSYRFNARLDMRMDQSQALSAYEIVNTYDQQALATLLYQYGEEPFSKRIAQNIVLARSQQEITSTDELVAVIKASLPQKILKKKGHPAKKTFQAIRIAVNDEINELKSGLEAGIELLKINGICCVISFHSLEDRIVKETFQKVSSIEKIDKRIPLTIAQMPKAKYTLMHRKVIQASSEELLTNNRAHSAKLRVLKRIR